MLKIDVSAWVPPSLMIQLNKNIDARLDKKDTDLMIFIPLEDYGPMMLEIGGQMGARGMGYMPFTPVIRTIPIAPHSHDFVAVMSRPYGEHTEPVLFDINGREHGV